ncbi:hypothetical protein [Streptomyces candidus]|uniref:Uncharacterized protein n=1 Tax=Streptomyces candidus TaxID=67283 RepID=A0A7X0HI98_9ACTN|nr:hypothetical protein [Streptomyces candidus]MBB6438116.1 hypothetical protein [Streptomyces candidus]GHH39226.1 hypothetical protein GCM10018773_18800 [Streptomyces candidus]
MSRALAPALATVTLMALLAAPALAAPASAPADTADPAPVAGPATTPIPVPECGGSPLDWADPGDVGGLYRGPVRFENLDRTGAYGFLAHLALDKHRLEADRVNSTEQWEIRRYFGEPAPSVLFWSRHGATVLNDPHCDDPARPTRVTSTTATVEGAATGRLTRIAP